jgi:hypothetical protein
MILLDLPLEEDIDIDSDPAVTPTEYINQTVAYLRYVKKKEISVSHPDPTDPDFYNLYIAGKFCGLWGSIGLAAVLSHYRNGLSPDYVEYFNLPVNL